MPKIIHYRSKCIGCGVCYEQQSECWRMSKKDGKATLLRSVNKKGVFMIEITGAAMLKSSDVAKACPVNIIKIV